MKDILRRKHPYFEHSDGDFFVARRDGIAVGRIAVLEPRRFNAYRGKQDARFYFFDCENNPEAARALFSAAAEWGRSRGLERLIGPQGFSGMSGGGILIDGFEHPPAMTMMNYNHPFYRDLVEGCGFVKYKDFFSAWLDGEAYRTPEKIARVAEITLRRGEFRLADLRTKKDLKKIAGEIGRIYNESWEDHEEYCPLTGREFDRLASGLLLVSDPGLIKVLLHRDEIAGFCLTFPDLSDALRRARGRLSPLSLIRLGREKKRTRKFIINGIGILPRFRNSGGTAVIYRELENTLKSRKVSGADLTQIAETTTLMLKDMETLGGRIYKTHRVYQAVIK